MGEATRRQSDRATVVPIRSEREKCEMSAKETVLQAVTEMPEESSWEEIMEELKILADLRRANEEIDAGDFTTHEDVKQEIAAWFSK